MSKYEEKISEYKKKIEQLRLAKQKADAREKTLKAAQERKKDTRRKILIGSMLLEAMRKNAQTNSQYLDHLGKYLTRNDDRALFDLPSIQENSAPASQPQKVTQA